MTKQGAGRAERLYQPGGEGREGQGRDEEPGDQRHRQIGGAHRLRGAAGQAGDGQGQEGSDGGGELAALLHRGEHVARAHQQLNDLIRDLVIEGAKTGALRDDVAPDELATYCLHALTAVSNLPSKAAVHRQIAVALAGLSRAAS